ncbi:MAG: hypothetical protein ABIW79_01840, partial [Gemmatimonas sp.]
LCVARAPATMALDEQRKAYPLARVHNWSPADGAFVRCCPVNAIQVAPISSASAAEHSSSDDIVPVAASA